MVTGLYFCENFLSSSNFKKKSAQKYYAYINTYRIPN